MINDLLNVTDIAEDGDPPTFETGDYLASYVESLNGIVRFIGEVYPPEIFQGINRDTVLTHIKHVVAIARGLPDDWFTKLGMNIETEVRILLVHDIPEITVGDKAVLNGQAPVAAAETEMHAAMALLNENDLALFLQFQAAEGFLQGALPSDGVLPSNEAMLAKVIDLLEGNYRFFQILDKYNIEKGFHPKTAEISAKAWEYFVVHSTRYTQMLGMYPSNCAELTKVIQVLFSAYSSNEIVKKYIK